MMDFNWFAVILLSIIPTALIIVAAEIVRDKINAKKYNNGKENKK